MRKSMRWVLPGMAALVLAVGAVGVRGADDAKKEAGKGNISGTVVDKDGKGVADVTVRLMKPFMRGGRGGGAGGPGGAGGEGRRPARDQASVGQQHGAAGLQAEGEKKPGDAGGPGAGQGRPPMPPPVAEATTDKDGKFEMKDVPAGDYMIGVRDMDKKVFGRDRVTVKDGETATVEIKTSDTPPQRGGPGGGQGGEGRGRGRGGQGGGAGGGEQK